MPRETNAAHHARVLALVRELRSTYPDAQCELNYTNPLELLVATILSAQCTDKQVNIVTQNLFKKYRSAADYAIAPLAELENDLRAIGLFRAKARNIKASCQSILDKHHGSVPRRMDQLIELAGVGRKTANVVLGNAFGIRSGIVVDTHVARLSQRLGLTRQTQPEKIEMELQSMVSPEDWTLFSHWLIWHGRRRCSARKPDCLNCEIRAICPATGVKL